MDNYAIYLRKSRADIELELRGEGDTLKKHETTLLALANQLHLNIMHIYREIVSGDTIAARPEMQLLLDAVSKGLYNGVLVMEIPRLARGDTIDQGIVAQTFLYSGTKIITPGKTYDPYSEFDQQFFEFGLFMSRQEYKTINRRMRAGIQACVKAGQYMGSIPPYGFDIDYRKKEHLRTLKENPAEAAIVRMIYDLRINGIKNEEGETLRLGYQRISSYLNNLGYRTRRGKVWNAIMVRDILDHVENYGMIPDGGRKQVKKMVGGRVITSRPRNKEKKIYKGIHDGIISEETFILAHQVKAPSTPTNFKLQNPFAGLLICKKCGSTMERRRATKDGTIRYCILCRTYGCECVGSFLTDVESAVFEALKVWLDGYKLKYNRNDTNTSAVSFKTDLLKHTDAEIDKLMLQKDRVFEFYERGEYDTDTFLRRSKLISEKIQAIELQKKKLESEIESEKYYEESRKNLIPKIENLIQVYPNLETAQNKNTLLKEVLEKIVYWKAEGDRWNGKHEIELTLYPKLPKR